MGQWKVYVWLCVLLCVCVCGCVSQSFRKKQYISVVAHMGEMVMSYNALHFMYPLLTLFLHSSEQFDCSAVKIIAVRHQISFELQAKSLPIPIICCKRFKNVKCAKVWLLTFPDAPVWFERFPSSHILETLQNNPKSHSSTYIKAFGLNEAHLSLQSSYRERKGDFPPVNSAPSGWGLRCRRGCSPWSCGPSLQCLYVWDNWPFRGNEGESLWQLSGPGPGAKLH